MSSVFETFVCSLRHDIVLDDMTVRLRPLAGYVPSPRMLGLGGQHTSYGTYIKGVKYYAYASAYCILDTSD